MFAEDQPVVLTQSQAACLRALRDGRTSLKEVAVTAKLRLEAAADALATLERLGLAEWSQPRARAKVWRLTSRGEMCRFDETAPGRPRENSAEPNENGRRLLERLERPIEVRKIARELGVSQQAAINIVHRLHAQGYLKFGDPRDPNWLVMRADDDTPLLSREEARVLSATPGSHATNAKQIRRRMRLSVARVETALDRLAQAGFVEAVGEFNGLALYRATATGLAHAQNSPAIREAAPPKLPVQSDRVRSVLSAIDDAGAMRIREVRDLLALPQKSINGLMQYLKGKQLVEKTGEAFADPYVLTALGRITLAEMMRPGHVQAGYEKGALGAVRRRGDDPRRLSREEGRVLSALPRQYPTDLAKVHRATPLSGDQVETALGGLMDRGLIEAAGEFDGRPLYRTTSAGAAHPQRRRVARGVERPRLPVYSNRVHAVLSAIANAGALRIKEVRETLQLPGQTTNSLMQYLKRRALIEKTESLFDAPYALTSFGRATMDGLAQRLAA